MSRQCDYPTGTLERCRRSAGRWGSRCYQHQGWEIEPLTAIEIVARQLVAEAAKQITWEDIPDIGEHDWLEVAGCIEREAAREPYGWEQAITLLTGRANQEPT